MGSLDSKNFRESMMGFYFKCHHCEHLTPFSSVKGYLFSSFVFISGDPFYVCVYMMGERTICNMQYNMRKKILVMCKAQIFNVCHFLLLFHELQISLQGINKVSSDPISCYQQFKVCCIKIVTLQRAMH